MEEKIKYLNIHGKQEVEKIKKFTEQIKNQEI